MTAPKNKGGSESPESRYQRQLKCQHQYDAWYVPYWDPNNKYRTCLNCEHVDTKYVGW